MVKGVRVFDLAIGLTKVHAQHQRHIQPTIDIIRELKFVIQLENRDFNFTFVNFVFVARDILPLLLTKASD